MGTPEFKLKNKIWIDIFIKIIHKITTLKNNGPCLFFYYFMEPICKPVLTGTRIQYHYLVSLEVPKLNLELSNILFIKLKLNTPVIILSITYDFTAAKV